MCYNVAILQHLVSQSVGLAGAQSYAILLNEQFLILAHGTRPELLFKSVQQFDSAEIVPLQTAKLLPNRPFSELSLNVSTFEYGLQHALQQPFFAAYTSPESKQLEQVAVVKLQTQSWLIAFVQPREVFLATANAQTMLTLGMVVIIIIVVIALALGGCSCLNRAHHPFSKHRRTNRRRGSHGIYSHRLP